MTTARPIPPVDDHGDPAQRIHCGTDTALTSLPPSQYHDVTDMFATLAALDPDTAPWRRQRDRIIERCLPLADHIARRYSGRGQDHDDLVQVARLGLVKAVNRFEVDRGSDFAAYAVPTMLGEVRRHFRDHGWAVGVPRRLKDLHGELKRARHDLSQQLGRAPTASELAEHTGVDRDDVVQAVIAANGYRTTSPLSVVTDHDDGDDSPFEWMGAVDAGLDKVLDIATVRPLLAALPDRERAILVMRFFDDMTQTQIAERIGISQMHVSRLLTRSLAALRHHADADPS